MEGYMKSGRANKLFKPTGKTDRNDLRQGKWKDYKVEYDFAVFEGKEHPRRLKSWYLTYGEGQYLDGEREGPWRCYIIEDKTFKRFPYKEVTYVRGVEQGTVTYTYPDGSKGCMASYVDGELQGETKTYYKNGALHLTFTYLNGRVEGQMMGFYNDGKLKFTDHYVNDTLQGPSVRYYPSGQVEEEFTYAAGEIHGTYRYYHPNGQLWVEWTYDNGKTMNVTGSYDAQGNPRDPGTLKDGNGTLLHYDENGRVYFVRTFKDGVVVSKEER